MSRARGAFSDDQPERPAPALVKLPPPVYQPVPDPPTSPSAPATAPAEPAAATKAARPRRSSPPSAPVKEAKAATSGGVTVVGSRIPTDLYDALGEHVARLDVAGSRPSYAQVVTWALEDQADDVAEQTLAILRASRRNRRDPRGSRKAKPSTPLTFRFWPEEVEVLDNAQAAIATHRSMKSDPVKVTRTAIITAALQVALAPSEKS